GTFLCANWLPCSLTKYTVTTFHSKNPTKHSEICSILEAIFYSFDVFFTMFASGISLRISTPSLDFAGYLTRGCTQPNTVHFTVKMLVAPAPIFLIVIGVILFKPYLIDEEMWMKNRKVPLEDLRDNG
uniref:Uncharacterized protein n=1 Tax=Callorhinchus milii TaxID=7868 RepID=A0A4W3H1B8_CALMI